MEYSFGTFGPFPLQRKEGLIDPPAFEDFWKEVKKSHPGLETAIGIYIVTAEGEGNKLEPWYVGKTDRGFQKRTSEHWKIFADLASKSPKGDLQIFLIARVTPRTNRFKRPGTKKSNSIDRLETLLIGACQARNGRFLNSKKISFQKELYVPGYINDSSSARDEAATALAAMLKG